MQLCWMPQCSNCSSVLDELHQHLYALCTCVTKLQLYNITSHVWLYMALKLPHSVTWLVLQTATHHIAVVTRCVSAEVSAFFSQRPFVLLQDYAQCMRNCMANIRRKPDAGMTNRLLQLVHEAFCLRAGHMFRFRETNLMVAELARAKQQAQGQFMPDLQLAYLLVRHVLDLFTAIFCSSKNKLSQLSATCPMYRVPPREACYASAQA